MSWRTVVITNSAKLDLQTGYMVVRGKTITRIHIDEMYCLVIENTSVSLTCALLSELMKKKIKVIFCDEKRNPSSELIPYYGSHDTSLKIRNQVEWDDRIKKSVWTEIVTEKIRKQKEILMINNKREHEVLSEYINEIEFADSSNREGHAAKVYFNALFGKKFNREEDNSINAALNYGYSIILSAVNREIVANGYITQLGLFHSNMFNPFNLSSDIMEPFRPLIDNIVCNSRLEKFGHDEKMCVLKILSDEVFINGKREYVTNAIKIYTKSIFDALCEKDTSMISFYDI